MSYESIKNEFESNSRVKFKLYSLEYLIERVDNYVQVYAIDYPTRKSKYISFEDLMNNYTVYNEPLIEQLDRINIINKGDEQ